ncbi:helix-turn-helix transcriptional regulator [Microbacterium betulae]|uniref:Helix-turn-helix transcriptional regulator n=1 Tax=Microbacterium betulae TaxID=2981139 RepID=A0AA97I3W5_9MICO|nr:helix-turn-helix transcriptional regulator [Microbacterium sp. AB]WOF21931.1 helix-turn-helix transcriptional regulator [Microbacterium sp. AB]
MPSRTNDHQPILARTGTAHSPIGPVAFDCVRVIVVRSGSAILFSEFGQKPVNVGDAVIVGANVLHGAEPEGHVTATTVYLDTDYVIDQVFWQHAALLQDRLEAQELAETVYSEPAQILRLGEERAGMLMPWLDELVERSVDGGFARNFYRMQAVWFSIAHTISPFMRVSPVRISASQRAHIRPSLPRQRKFAPLRAEARRAAELLRQAPEARWTLDALASHVHLSPSQLSRVFAEAYGKTPLAYLTMLRAEHLAKCLRDTDLPIETAMRQVGWRSRGHAAQQFRKYVGMTPRRYRQLTLRMS